MLVKALNFGYGLWFICLAVLFLCQGHSTLSLAFAAIAVVFLGNLLKEVLGL